MYETGTILERKEPLGTEEDPNAYDRIQVLGASPVVHSGPSAAEWAGTPGAAGVLIQPAGDTFGSTVDKPFGELQQLYRVVHIPERTQIITPQVTRYDALSYAAGKSPEQAFAEAATDPDD